MRFQILSHAGLMARGGDTTLVCDPWLVGSTYWRSWWNYPPVPKGLLASLKPDYIYLTHIHWDHFQGVSLRKFGKRVPILIPMEPGRRMRRDLERMGFERVIELRHGETLELSGDFRITSYHFHVFLDSALVIESEGYTLLNANDCKIMGAPLGQILRRHPAIDFVFRSHSSANSRLCYELIGDPDAAVDDPGRYVRDFALFARSVRARYAIPFASNHCYLHKEVFRFNDKATTPQMVKEFAEDQGIREPEIRIMVAGDSWDDQAGFRVAEHDYFTRRDAHLEAYRESVSARLEETYDREAHATMDRAALERYFSRALAAMPRLWRWLYRGHPILYVLHSGKDGERRYLFEVDVHRGRVRELDHYDDRSHPIQIHTAAAIMRHCMVMNLFTHLAISKRVRYRVTPEAKRLLVLLNLFFNFYEYELLPLRNAFSRRFWSAWLPRWRELFVYARMGRDFALGRGFDMSRHLPVQSLGDG